MYGLILVAGIMATTTGSSVASPASEAHDWATFLEKVPLEESQYYRALSFYNLADNPGNLSELNKILRFWINNLHFESDVEFLKPVPNSKSLMFLDLRDYGWNKFAFSAVANRETYFVEPHVNSGTAIFLRKIAGLDQNPKTLHAETIVRADWFLRETSDFTRSPSYVDLLFAKQRFVIEEQREWYKGGKDKKGIYFAPGYYGNDTFKFVDFPKNEEDFEKSFNIDKAFEFINKTKFNLQSGAIIEEGLSVVSFHNRLWVRTQGNIGPYHKIFDVDETSGRQDFAETLNEDFEFKAGEILTRLPAGGQAAAVVDNKGKILTKGAANIVADKSDLRLSVEVRTMTSCIVCHETGYIVPSNLVKDMLKSGIDIRFKSKYGVEGKKKARDARGFFLGWEKTLKHDQEQHAEFLLKTSGYDPAKNSVIFKKYRDLYDAPVDLIVASKEIGLSPEIYALMISRSTKARVLNLIQGLSMPRRTWEIDGYKESILQINAWDTKDEKNRVNLSRAVGLSLLRKLR